MNERTKKKICQHVANAVTHTAKLVGLQWEKEMESATETASRGLSKSKCETNEWDRDNMNEI